MTNVKDQINSIKRLGTNLKYGAKERDQLCNFPKNIKEL